MYTRTNTPQTHSHHVPHTITWCVCEGGGERGWLASVCVWGGRGDGQRFFTIMEGVVGKEGEEGVGGDAFQ